MAVEATSDHKSENEAKVSSEQLELAGKYLTFVLGTEQYGLGILKVREIIGLVDITPVPRAPSFVRGVINLRGRIIPVIELRRVFEMEAVDATRETCIVVVDVPKDDRTIEIGVVVDSVSEVLDISAEIIDPAPTLDLNIATDMILGMARVEKAVKILLDIDSICSKLTLPDS